MKYNPNKIEKKWQKVWEETGLYKTGEAADKPKYYVLDMFPYPSGAGLHVGHPKGYIATDVVARFKMLNGFNVLHPMGWDAFGLPAENYALEMKVHPRIATEKNIKRFKKQLEALGLTYDWDREINTTDPEYYKWTQWIFLQLFKKGLAYESYKPINWCPSCKTGLANEDLEDGKCERCGSEVEQKPMRQWVLKITDYAEKMLDGLKDLDWENSIIQMQRNWIGKSEGAEIEFRVEGKKSKVERVIKVFTTRPDTLFGATYCVLAPEHELIEKLKDQITNFAEVEKYQEQARKKTQLERTDLNKEKTGVELEGIKAINPANNEDLPIFIADYVLTDYGTGAIMAVPAHDERDWSFAEKYNLPIRQVIISVTDTKKSKILNPKSEINSKFQIQNSKKLEAAYTEDGVLIDSGKFDGMDSEEVKEKITKWLQEKGLGKKTINYKLQDWVFSRQRYWGEPLPLVFCGNCRKKLKGISNFQFPISKHPPRRTEFKIQGLTFNLGEVLNPGWISVPEKDLPLELPNVKSYEPTGTGESPLVNIDEWVNIVCPKCGGSAKRETNTMPQWAGSCWYYLRYIDPKNDNELVNPEKEKYWQPVDLYVGGAEHATRHLIYARFWHHFLYDIGAVSTSEPFKKLQQVGLIMAEDGRKMSKRWNNVINPDDIVKEYGADAMRVYEMFMGPFDNAIAWSTQNLIGARRFLDKIWDYFNSYIYHKEKSPDGTSGGDMKLPILHKTIKKVTEDIEGLKFNTAISQMMILLNNLREFNEDKKGKEPDGGYTFFDKASDMETMLILLSPFAPHIAEELWEKLGNEKSIFLANWPEYDEKFCEEDTFTLVVQINGKVRDSFEAAVGIAEEEAKRQAMEREVVKKWTDGKEIKRVIFVPNKLINIVI